eukprot:6518718-Alexandrium_andersonii.AAC.1
MEADGVEGLELEAAPGLLPFRDREVVGVAGRPRQAEPVLGHRLRLRAEVANGAAEAVQARLQEAQEAVDVCGVGGHAVGRPIVLVHVKEALLLIPDLRRA